MDVKLVLKHTNGIKALSVVHWVLIGDITIDTVFFNANLPPFSCTCYFETCLSPHLIVNTFCSSTKNPE